MAIHFDQIVDRSLEKLEKYIISENYKGWDPYDGLNSKFFQNFSLLNKSKFIRLAWIQLFKRNPINLRRIFLVEKEYNSKGVALFLSAYCKLYVIDQSPNTLQKINKFAELLLNIKSTGWSGDCWGYNFDWQAKAFFQPKNTPTVVASVYAASALLEAFEITREKKYLESVISCGNFILKDLNRTYDNDGNFCFSYSPLDSTKVFNASLLGSKLLGLLFKYTGNIIYKEEARKSVNYCCKMQSADGSWIYGEQPFHNWIDNFHTGFNLECLYEYQVSTDDFSFQDNIDRGFNYYINTFFLNDGKSKYYNNETFPIDIHSPAQLVVTLHKLNKAGDFKDTYQNVLKWTVNNMQDPKGFFYYQFKKFITSKIPYMRWAQAWMFNALATAKLIEYESRSSKLSD